MEYRHIKYIIKEAKRRGMTIRKAPSQYDIPGKRISTPKQTGADLWANAANLKLWKWQTGQD